MYYYNHPAYGQRPVYPPYPQYVPTPQQEMQQELDEEDTREILEHHVGEIVVARIPTLFEGRRQVFIYRVTGGGRRGRATIIYGDSRDGGRCSLRRAVVRARDVDIVG